MASCKVRTREGSTFDSKLAAPKPTVSQLEILDDVDASLRAEERVAIVSFYASETHIPVTNPFRTVSWFGNWIYA